jgi:CRP-like cAMP-binding protein
MPVTPRSANQLLAALPPADFELLRPHLRSVDFVQGDVLFHTGDTIHRVYFPHIGVISIVVDLAEGGMIEAAMVGRDSIAGASAALDGGISLNVGIVQLPGNGCMLGVPELRKIADDRPSFRTMLMRHEQALFAQAQQSAACNVSHGLENRLARWLLRTRDLSESHMLPLTQEFLGQMLGVQRSSVSVIAHALQQAGLIRYSRGRIQITDLDGLKAASCECYARVKSHCDRLVTNSSLGSVRNPP